MGTEHTLFPNRPEWGAQQVPPPGTCRAGSGSRKPLPAALQRTSDLFLTGLWEAQRERPRAVRHLAPHEAARLLLPKPVHGPVHSLGNWQCLHLLSKPSPDSTLQRAARARPQDGQLPVATSAFTAQFKALVSSLNDQKRIQTLQDLLIRVHGSNRIYCEANQPLQQERCSCEHSRQPAALRGSLQPKLSRAYVTLKRRPISSPRWQSPARCAAPPQSPWPHSCPFPSADSTGPPGLLLGLGTRSLLLGVSARRVAWLTARSVSPLSSL